MIMVRFKGSKLVATHSFTVMPKDNNYAGTLFGGKLMYEMDYAGVKVVRRALYGVGVDGVVTASVERVDFLKPALTGDIITMRAEIIKLGSSSILVDVNVSRESVNGDVEGVCSSKITFVAIKNKKTFKHNLSMVDLIKTNKT